MRRRRRGVAGFTAVLAVVSLVMAPAAQAFVFVVPAPSFPDTVVGQTAPAALGINNSSTPPESVTDPVLTITNIDLYPSCTTTATDCIGGTAEPGVYALSPTGTGVDGPTCTGTWTIVPNTGNPATATSYRFIPPGGEGTPLLLAVGETCVVNFTITTLRVPTNDVEPATPGVQTIHLACTTAIGTVAVPPPGLRNCGSDVSTVTAATPNLATVAAQSSPTIPGTTTDTATLSPPPPPSSAFGAPPTGTITFNLFGPFFAAPGPDACFGPPVFTDTATVNGFADYTSDPAPITAPGVYNWTATYSGDANYNAVGPVGCGDLAEQVTFAPAQSTIVTQATPSAPFGQPISDTATVTGFNPTGGVTFNVFGPDDPTCAGAPVFTHFAPVTPVDATTSTATSDPFTPTAPGTYRWIASYSGDANNAPATTQCNDPNETSLVGQVTIVTQARTPVTLTQPIADTAILTPVPATGPPPTGVVTFTLFGPDDPTCAGPPIFTSANRPISATAPFTATSGEFTPTQPGTYQWVVAYSGDANYPPATSPCGAPNEQSVVTPFPTIDVIKDAAPPSRPEPGGDFTYTVTVTNTSNENLTITSLNDNVYGDLATRPGSTCGAVVGQTLTPGQPAQCTFTAPFTGNAGDSLTDVVTVRAVNPAGVEVTDQDDAVVTLTPEPPLIQVIKDATPPSLPEPGGDFTYTVTVSNPGTLETITITSLTDSVYGDLATRPGSTCGALIGTTLAPGATSAPCTFTAPFTGNPGDSLTDVVTATGTDDDGQTATDTDDAVVTITPVAPAIQVEKDATPPSRPEPGGDFTYTVTVSNPGPETITITSLNDSVYGNLATRPGSTCGALIGTTLAPGATSAPCTFTAPFTGNAGDSLTDVVTATGVDDDGQTVTDTDDAVVTLTGVPPTVLVDKTANPLSRPEPGGAFTFTVVVTNTSNEPVTITTLTDDVYGNLATRGTCTTAIGTVLAPAPGPGNTYTCSFTATVLGNAGDSQRDTVTVVVRDDDNQTATDTDDAIVTITPVPPTVVVDKTADPTSRPEPGGTFTFTVRVTNTSFEPVTITSLTDDVYGNLATRGTCTTAIGTVLAPAPGPGNTYTCSFTATFNGRAGDRQTDIVTVIVRDNDNQTATDTDDATVTITQPPPPPVQPPPVQPPLPAPKIAFTGGSADQQAKVASGFVALGLMLVIATWRSRGGLAFAGLGGSSGSRLRFQGPERPEPPLTGPMAFQGQGQGQGPSSGRPGGHPGSTALVPPLGEMDVAEIWAPVKRRPSAATGSRLASGLGLAGGAAPVRRAAGSSPAARAALSTLGMRIAPRR